MICLSWEVGWKFEVSLMILTESDFYTHYTTGSDFVSQKTYKECKKWK